MSLTTCDTEIPLDTLAVRRLGLVREELDGEAVLYDPAHHSVHYFNATANLIWGHCDGRTSVGEIVERVAQGFDMEEPADEAAILAHMTTALASLEQSGLVDLTRPVLFTGECPCQA